MTTLYIVRHAYAGKHGDPRYPDDSLRPLTTAGTKQFRKAAKKLVKRGLAPTAIATSPFVRCWQTADLLADLVQPAPRVVELAALEPGSDFQTLVAWSREQDGDVAWVGHVPDVERFAARLLGAPGGALRFRKGAVAALEFHGAAWTEGAARLRYFVAPRDLGCLRSDDA